VRPALDIRSLSDRQIAEHVMSALSGTSGDVLKQVLRKQCFMEPAKSQPAWDEAAAVYRNSRRDLFLLLEYYENPENFPKDTQSRG
jgi:hypothetical protein